VKVHLVGSPSPELSATFQRLRERGDAVSSSAQVPPDADVYFFYDGHEAMKQLARGLVILDLRDDITLGIASWAPYADLCLVRSEQDQAALVDAHSCEPERIFVVVEDGVLIELVDQAVRDLLPPAEVEEKEETMADRVAAAEQTTSQAASQIAGLAARLEAIELQADIMQRGYRVRSTVPVIGPLIAWVRRNLTSHLREPYLDPTLERQVAVNRDMVTVVRGLLDRQAELEKRLARLEEERRHD